MKNSIIIALLQQFGLTEKEAATYLTCLEKEQSTPAEVSAETGEKRTTVYHHLDTLVGRGLVVREKEDGKTRFRPVQPAIWKLMVEEQQRLVQDLIPMLREVSGRKRIDPKIESFRGASVTQVFERMLQAKEKTVYVFRSLVDIDDVAGRKYHFSERRRKAGIFVRYLESRQHPHKTGYAREHQTHMREVRQLPVGIEVPSSVMLWDHYVSWIAPSERFAVMTETKDFSEFMKTIFRVLWEVSKPI